jgi:hypothetical protein
MAGSTGCFIVPRLQSLLPTQKHPIYKIVLHQYKSLGEDEMRFVFPKIGSKMGKEYDPEYFADYEAMNTIIRKGEIISEP